MPALAPVTWRGRAYSSLDGATWVAGPELARSGAPAPTGVVFTADRFVIGFHGGAVLESRDGSSWDYTPPHADTYLNAIGWDGDTLLLGGEGGSTLSCSWVRGDDASPARPPGQPAP